MNKEQEQILWRAADHLRKEIEDFRCSHFQSLLGLNNIYFLNLYLHIQETALASLATNAHDITQPAMQEALMASCHAYCVRERRAVPYGYESKNAAFLNNLYQVLNTPFFTYEMTRSQNDPAMVFAQKIWNVYTENGATRFTLTPRL